MHTIKSCEVYISFWLTSLDFMMLLCSGKYLLYQDDSNKMAAGVTFVGVSLLIPCSVICMKPVKALGKVMATHHSAPCQGKGCDLAESLYSNQ